MEKVRAARNRTLVLSESERVRLRERLLVPGGGPLSLQEIINRTIRADLLSVLDLLPVSSVDLLIIDPPYNLDKNFHGLKFTKTGDDAYLRYLESWFPALVGVLKPEGSVYLCGDWRSSACLYRVMRDWTVVRNRIVWQREKGRGAGANWKSTSEDIWFGTRGDDYYFDTGAVKQKRRVLAPYRENGAPKDWAEEGGGRFRLTHAGNFWDDISVPYWSMRENTDHPAQKPEKLVAKLILASCPEGGIVLDPFLGSGTSSVTAKKLRRRYIGIELNEEYCLWAEKRLAAADHDTAIQGYSDGVFWERNTLNRPPAGLKQGVKVEGAAHNEE
ncbi:MAG: site-specific DNA-methyltransferase [Spirochaetaceae bacterium]|jgi:site-specific DNA-methyltransferase (adenine-specific)|nr:site-specific DNA-methyltransferase [Spirochaetaceae bacterium]